MRRDDSFLLDNTLDSLRHKLLENVGSTKNFASLVKVFIARASELKSSVQTGDTMFIWQAYNALFMVRNVVKYFVEVLNEEDFAKQFQPFDFLTSKKTITRLTQRSWFPKYEFFCGRREWKWCLLFEGRRWCPSRIRE